MFSLKMYQKLLKIFAEDTGPKLTDLSKTKIMSQCLFIFSDYAG
jgi:hypothetical protein